MWKIHRYSQMMVSCEKGVKTVQKGKVGVAGGGGVVRWGSTDAQGEANTNRPGHMGCRNREHIPRRRKVVVKYARHKYLIYCCVLYYT